MRPSKADIIHNKISRVANAAAEIQTELKRMVTALNDEVSRQRVQIVAAEMDRKAMLERIRDLEAVMRGSWKTRLRWLVLGAPIPVIVVPTPTLKGIPATKPTLVPGPKMASSSTPTRTEVTNDHKEATHKAAQAARPTGCDDRRADAVRRDARDGS